MVVLLDSAMPHPSPRKAGSCPKIWDATAGLDVAVAFIERRLGG
jgi:hypothetical protein